MKQLPEWEAHAKTLWQLLRRVSEWANGSLNGNTGCDGKIDASSIHCNVCSSWGVSNFFIKSLENTDHTSCDHDSNLEKAQEFDDIEEKWPQCVRQLGHYFSAFVITEEDKNRAVHVSLCVVVQFEVIHEIWWEILLNCF